MKKAPLFYCDNCGLPVPAGAGFCPHCGGAFRGIRCPSCGFQGEEEAFRKGCPSCGFLTPQQRVAQMQSGNGGSRKTRKNRRSREARREGPEEGLPRKKPLPGWLYTLILLGLLILLGVFMVLLIFQVLES